MILHVDSSEPNKGVKVVEAIPDECECGGTEFDQGVGLFGGGYGVWAICDACDTVYKVIWPPDED